MREERLVLRAAIISAALSVLFLVVYPLCNWLTSLRHDVPSFYFGWERRIPFLPWLIVPYLSQDVFFVIAPFLTKRPRELVVFAWRVVAAILIAAACFLLFPLRVAFEQPKVAGWMGMLFDHFRSIDAPFNECPSLHIALLMLIADVYFRNTRGVVRVLIGAWFALIAASPVLVYQHHVIDIVGGFLLGAFCLHFFREEGLRRGCVPNYRVGAYYGVGAAVLIVAAFLWRPWSLLLLWPGFSLAIVALAYVWLGRGIYRKEKGRLGWTTWVFLWPVLVGQRLSLLYYARRCTPWDRLTDELIIGRRLSGAEARRLLAEHSITGVLDLTCEFSESKALRGLPYLQLPILDLTAPEPGVVEAALAFIREHSVNGAVYVHCKIGFSRTAAIAGCYLQSASITANAEETLQRLRSTRSGMVIRPEVVRCLERYADRVAASGVRGAYFQHEGIEGG